MKTNFHKLLIILLLTIPIQKSLCQNESEFYVVSNSNIKIFGTDISANSAGIISLKLPGGGIQNFKKGSYKIAHCPEPKAIKEAEKKFQDNEYSEAYSLLEKELEKYCHLGWAGKILTMMANLLYKQDKHDDAIRLMEIAQTLPIDDNDKSTLTKQRIQIALLQEEYAIAEKQLKNLDPLNAKFAPFIYNSRGEILESNGDERGAILQYLKTILLYPKAKKFRKQAYQKVITILKDLNDDRYIRFLEKMNKEYPK